MELFQLLLAAEHAHAAGGGTAGKAAARVDDLAVQGDDAVAVAQIAGHGRSLGEVLHHNDAAQQVIDDILIAADRAALRSAATSGGAGEATR